MNIRPRSACVPVVLLLAALAAACAQSEDEAPVQPSDETGILADTARRDITEGPVPPDSAPADSR